MSDINDHFLGNSISTSHNIKSTISANFLANFMPKLEFLENALKNQAFIPRYYFENVGDFLEIYIGDKKIKRIAFPMTCFCDIKLHQITAHIEFPKSKEIQNESLGYGKFGIALEKAWGIKQGIQPVVYLNEESAVKSRLESSLNYLLNYEELIEPLEAREVLSDTIIEQLRYTKPLSGTMLRRNSRNEEEKVEKNFHDENEWRYIPKISEKDAPNLLIDPIHGDAATDLGISVNSSAIATIRKAYLKFAESDVKYVFVATSEDRDKLIDFIWEMKSKKYSVKEKRLLTSKIVVYDDIKGDW